jgi:hypothetical protein
MPRSGTSLVEQIIASHPDVHGAGELTLFDRAIDEVGCEDVTALGSRYLALVDEIAPGGKRVVDKLPSNFRHVPLIRLALPRASIVHCVRDPLDTCFSAYTTLFTGRQDWSFDLTEAGRYYRSYAALMEHWHALLGPDAMLDVRYEDLIAGVEAGARRLLAFCGLTWNDAVLRYYESSRPVRTASYRQVRQPIYTSSIGSAQRYRAQLQPLIDALTANERDTGGGEKHISRLRVRLPRGTVVACHPELVEGPPQDSPDRHGSAAFDEPQPRSTSSLDGHQA